MTTNIQEKIEFYDLLKSSEALETLDLFTKTLSPSEKYTVTNHESLKLIRRSPLELAGDKFEELYQELVNYGDWNNDEMLESVYLHYEEDRFNLEQLLAINSKLENVLLEEEDKKTKEDNKEFREDLRLVVNLGFPNALGY